MVNANKNMHLFLLVIIVLFGALIRLYNLTYQSLWLDEVFTYNVAQLSFQQILSYTASGVDVHPPLFYLIERISVLILGNTDFAIRIFPAIFGILTIPVFYLIGTEIYNNKFGILMAILISISPMHLFLSQDARMYTMLLFFISLGMYFLFKVFNDTNFRSSKNYIFAFFFLGISVYIHFISLILIIPIMISFIYLIVIATRTRQIEGINKGYIYGIITYILVVLPSLPIIIKTLLINTSNPFYLYGNKDIIFTGVNAITRTITQLIGTSSMITLIMFVLLVIGIYNIGRINSTTAIITWGISLTSFIVLFFISFKLTMEPRYFIFLLPITTIYISAGIYYIFEAMQDRYTKLNSTAIFTTLVLCVILIHTPYINYHCTEFTKPDWKGATTILSNITNDNNIVVLLPGGNQHLINVYYNATNDNTTIIYANDIQALDTIYSKKYNCCSCNPACAPWKVIFIIPGDIKYDNNKVAYYDWLKIHNCKFIQKYDTFEFYEMK